MLRKQSDENDPADWFYLAADRLRAADVVWSAEGLTASGVELLQEAVERYLKGFLIAKGWRLAKIHDLVTLAAQAATYDPRFDSYRAFAQELTDDFFAQHYPGADWQLIGQNYEDLRRQAGEIVSLIKESLPQFSLQPPRT